MTGEMGSIASDYDNNNNIVCVPVSLVYSRASRPGLHRWIYVYLSDTHCTLNLGQATGGIERNETFVGPSQLQSLMRV